MSTTATTIITGAYEMLGVISPNDTLPSVLLTKGFRRLNLMMGSWARQSLTIPVIDRDVFPTVTGKGSTANPYTVGIGGDLNMQRPTALDGAGLLLLSSQPVPVELPRALYTDDAYEAVQIKDLTNGLFTGVYYNPTFPLGTLNLWPVPDGSVPTSIVLYHLHALTQFVSPAAVYDLPEGADEAVEYNLALRLADPSAVPAERLANIQSIARSSLAVYKRSNTKIVDMPIDPAFTQSRRGGYNIDTGQ